VISIGLRGKRGMIIINHLEGVAKIRDTMGISKAKMVVGVATAGPWVRMSDVEGDAYGSWWQCWGWLQKRAR
jgi:hypothetical protein